MAALLSLLALLLVDCCQVASLPVAGSPAAPNGTALTNVTDHKMADTELTHEQKSKRLQEIFTGASEEIFGFIRNLVHDAEPTAADHSIRADSQPYFDRIRRAADSTTGHDAHHGHYPDAHQDDSFFSQAAVYSGYPEANLIQNHYAPPPPPQVHTTYVPVPSPAPYVPVPAPAPYVPVPAPAPYVHVPAPSPRPSYMKPLRAKTISEIWDYFVTEPLQESYYDILAFLPIDALYSLLFEHQYLNFDSLRTYTANKLGFITAMQNVFHAPSEELEQIGAFFDTMTALLPSRFFGDGRSLADLVKEIRLYFAANYPLLQFLAPETHYYAK